VSIADLILLDHNTMAQTDLTGLPDVAKDGKGTTVGTKDVPEKTVETSSGDGSKGSDAGSSSNSVKEIIDLTQIDPVLAKKLAIVNQGIDDIGMTSYHWQLFALNGFGYAVDSVSVPTTGFMYFTNKLHSS
jgi:hypothetical protein